MADKNKPDNDPILNPGLENDEISESSNSAQIEQSYSPAEGLTENSEEELNSRLDELMAQSGMADTSNIPLDQLMVGGGNSSEIDNSLSDESDDVEVDEDEALAQFEREQEAESIEAGGFIPTDLSLSSDSMSDEDIESMQRIIRDNNLGNDIENQEDATEDALTKAEEAKESAMSTPEEEVLPDPENMTTEELEALPIDVLKKISAAKSKRDAAKIVPEPVVEPEAKEESPVVEPEVEPEAQEEPPVVEREAQEESPVAESPVAESPVAESPVAESPVAESLVEDDHAVQDIPDYLDIPVFTNGDKATVADREPLSTSHEETVNSEPVAEIIEEPVAESVEDAVDAPVAETIEEPVAESVEDAVDTPVAETIEEPVAESVEDAVDTPVAETIEDPVAESVEDAVDAPVAGTIENPVAESVGDAIDTPVAETIEDSVNEWPVIEEPKVNLFSQKMAESREKQAKALREEIGITDEYISPPIVQYQKYMLTLQELNRHENLGEFKEFVNYLVEKTGNKDNLDATGEDLANIDIEMGQIHLNTLRQIAPHVVDKVEANISDNYDAFGALKEAGFNLADTEGSIPLGFPEDLQVMMAYDDAFPDENRPTIVERLKDNKKKLMKVFKSDKANIATSTVAFGIACAAGSAVLPLAGALYASKLMANPVVQEMANSMHRKIGAHLVTLGFKKENIQEREIHLGDKMKGIMDSKWGKAAGIGLAASVCGFGLYSLMDATGFGMKDVKDFASTAGGKIADVSAMIVNGEIPDFPSTENVLSSIKSGVAGAMATVSEAWGSHAKPGLVNLGKYFGFEDATISSAVDTVSEGVDKIAEVVAEAASENTELLAKDGDTLWTMAKNHYMAQSSGKIPSPQQIIAMINDLGLSDPGNIQPGDKFSFVSDVAKYAGITSVDNPGWLIDAGNAVKAAQDAGTVINSGLVNVGSMFDVSNIAEVVGGQKLGISELASLAESNPDLDLDNLMPGDTINFENGGSYTVPSIENAIALSVFPAGVPEYIDTEKLLDFIQEQNPDIDLSEGLFDIPSLFGNSDLGKEMANMGVLNIPEINLADLNNPVSGDVQISGGKGFDVNRAILRAAYPDGIPELLNRSDFIASVKEANPGLGNLSHNERFNITISIPEIDANNPAAIVNDGSLAQGHQVSGEPSDKTKSNFIKRFLKMDNDPGLNI